MKIKMKTALLRGKKGEAYLDTLISIFIIMLFICIVIVVVPIFIRQYHLDMFADKISDYIAVNGGTGGIDIAGMAREANFDDGNFTYSVEVTDGAPASPGPENPEKIQLTGKYTVKVTTTVYIGLGGILNSVPITLESVATGRSEVYWKDESLNKMI